MRNYSMIKVLLALAHKELNFAFPIHTEDAKRKLFGKQTVRGRRHFFFGERRIFLHAVAAGGGKKSSIVDAIERASVDGTGEESRVRQTSIE